MQVSRGDEIRMTIETGNNVLAAKEGKRLVVLGSSFISMELVVAVAKRGLASIDVVGMEEVPFEPILGTEVGRGLKQVRD